MEINKIHNMDCLAGLKLMEDKSVHCVVTSPPYWGLRDYGVKGQLGLEKTPRLFIKRMVAIFKEIKRVLRDDGTVWLNIGDSYCSTGPNSKGDKIHIKGIKNKTAEARANHRPATPSGMKPKDLVGIPWMLAFALRDDGWYLRQDIIWSKPFGMPESVQDRCTKSHEYIFLLSKREKYFFDIDAIKTPLKDSSINRYNQNIEAQQGSPVPFKTNGNMKAKLKGYDHRNGDKKINGHKGNYDENGKLIGDGMANKRSVWVVNPANFPEAHFATFPEDLIIDCIKAGCPAEGIVLDPFMGAGTTALVAQKLNRNFIGFELNSAYVKMANKRLNSHLGMFSPENIKAISPQPIQLTIE